MEERVLTALQGSIDKWVGIAYHGKVDGMDSDCPLCGLFMETDDSCSACPIGEDTGETGCKGTPYQAWIAHTNTHEEVQTTRERKVYCPTCREKAIEMVNYLKGLLPEDAGILTITEEAVEKAIEECPESKCVLETLFPDVVTVPEVVVVLTEGNTTLYRVADSVGVYYVMEQEGHFTCHMVDSTGWVDHVTPPSSYVTIFGSGEVDQDSDSYGVDAVLRYKKSHGG